MKAFVSTLLAYDPKHENTEGGILGVVKAYYGCVEAQGRGTLHCHMMVWIEGGLSPSALKDRLLSDSGAEFGRRLIGFLDDTISNEIPPPLGPTAVEINRDSPSKIALSSRGDLRLLVASCQNHKHSETCYKYVKEGELPKCRFELDESIHVPQSTVDLQTGDLKLRCLDGLINNFNATLIEALRCNMDLQFIGTGDDAKAVIYYITDYITKSQLKSHIAYASLALGVKKAMDADNSAEEIDCVTRAKRTLQKCAFSLIANQELSAQQVSAYLSDLDDHFTSDEFANLYWTAFERYIERLHPSPECYGPPSDTSETGDTINELSHTAQDDVDEQASSEDTVAIGTDRHGDVVPLSDQLCDYRYRGIDLDRVSVWDFVAQTQK
ncbi:hypothetical protein C2E23DRAFT_697591, partial [Lenzites betulinus]